MNARILLLIATLLSAFSAQAEQPTCLWVSSYHSGYEWNDGIERGIRDGLKGQCKLEVFHMDTKRHTGVAHGEQKAAEARALIDVLKPDVVLLSDDNASRYLAVPYLKGSSIPLVFCGVNWNADAYGYPWPNASGMVEVAPVLPLLKEIRQVVEKPRRGLYLSSAVYTEQVDAEHYKKAFARQGIAVDTLLVDNLSAWKEGYIKGQGYDFIVLGNYAGISDWDNATAVAIAKKYAKRITVTNYDWMMPFAMVGKTKIPDEQGEWVAQIANEVLSGVSAGAIPVVANRRWTAYINTGLLQQAGITLNRNSMHNAIKVEQ